MNFANVKLKDDLIIDPHLLPFVERIVLDNPSFVISHGTHTGRTSSGCVMGVTAAPEGKRFISRLEVVYAPTNEHMGMIGVKRKYKSRGPDELAYFIQSWRIRNQRGDQNISTTTKLTGALRIAKKALVPRVYDEVYTQIGEDVASSFAHAIRSLVSPIRNGHLLMQGGVIVMQSYLYDVCNGREAPSELKQRVTDTFTSERYRHAMEEYALAEQMENYYGQGRLCLIAEHGAGYVFKKDGVVVCEPFDTLVDWAQNHISVLQLMQDNELINGVGYRCTQGKYLIVSPE